MRLVRTTRLMGHAVGIDRKAQIAVRTTARLGSRFRTRYREVEAVGEQRSRAGSPPSEVGDRLGRLDHAERAPVGREDMQATESADDRRCRRGQRASGAPLPSPVTGAKRRPASVEETVGADVEETQDVAALGVVDMSRLSSSRSRSRSVGRSRRPAASARSRPRQAIDTAEVELGSRGTPKTGMRPKVGSVK